MNKGITLGEYLIEKVEIPTIIGMLIAALTGAISMYFMIAINLIKL